MWTSRCGAAAGLALGLGCASAPIANDNLGPTNNVEAGAIDSRAPEPDARTVVDVVASEPIPDVAAIDVESERGPSPSDAAADVAGPSASVESIRVEGGAPISFKTSLPLGATYLLKATG